MISYMPDSLPEIAKKLVYDVATMDQTGCLSVQNAYLIGYSDSDFNSFLNELESAFQEFTSQQSTPEQREISVYGAIHNLREIYTYKAANEARTTIRHSRDSSWTIIHDPNQLLQASPSGNVLFLHRINSLVETATIPLPPNNRSSVSLYPYSQEKAERLLSHFPCPRISPLGLIQKTPLMWNADGFSPLHSLVNWVDLR